MYALPLIFFLLTLGCSMLPSIPEKPVSVTQLLKNSNIYDGKKIVADGFLNWEFEGFCLYASLEDLESGNTDISISIAFPPDFNASHLHRRHVKVVGVYSKEETGHMSMWPGGIRTDSIQAAEH